MLLSRSAQRNGAWTPSDLSMIRSALAAKRQARSNRKLDLELRNLDAERIRAEERLTQAHHDLRTHSDDLAEMEAQAAVARDASSTAEDDWGRGERAARERCSEDARDEGRLRNVANDTLAEALREVGMRRDEDSAPTDELVEAWRRRRADENTPFPMLAVPLADHLEALAERDVVLRTRIEEERERSAEARDTAQLKVDETRTALERLQDAIETSIEAAIELIAEQFNNLDREAGGYGAELKLDMRRPVDATDIWRWSITPMWRRSPGGSMVPYTAPTNSAQDKLYTVHLVLAALLAVPNPEGRVLILDELGDSLGFEHRRDMLRAIAATAHAKGITVLGTCQDDVLHHAADFTQQIVFFEYADDRDLLNRPVRLFGYDPQGARVELLSEAVLRGRPVV